jgi:hypothetical protein
MKVLLEIEDKKAHALMEVLKDLKYVKTITIKETKKEAFLKGLKEAVEEVKLAKQGKVKLKTFDEFQPGYNRKVFKQSLKT